MDTVVAIGLIGITQGISSWVYYYLFPTNFFFTVIFCHKNGGLLLAFLVNKFFNVKNKYIEEFLFPLIPGIIACQLMRLEVFTREHYILPNIINLSGLEILIFYMIPFYTFWAFVTWARKKLNVLPVFYHPKQL